MRRNLYSGNVVRMSIVLSLLAYGEVRGAVSAGWGFVIHGWDLLAVWE
jgi:hypothetical protein